VLVEAGRKPASMLSAGDIVLVSTCLGRVPGLVLAVDRSRDPQVVVQVHVEAVLDVAADAGLMCQMLAEDRDRG
jgi:hypothetical protein